MCDLSWSIANITLWCTLSRTSESACSGYCNINSIHIPCIMHVIHLIQTKCAMSHTERHSVTILCAWFSQRKYNVRLLTENELSWNYVNNLVTAVDKMSVDTQKMQQTTRKWHALQYILHSSRTESVCQQSSCCWAWCSLGRGNNRNRIRKCVMEITL